jgi:hypothetical protein
MLSLIMLINFLTEGRKGTKVKEESFKVVLPKTKSEYVSHNHKNIKKLVTVYDKYCV